MSDDDMYEINCGNMVVELPSLNVEDFDKLMKEGMMEVMFGKEIVSLMRKNFLVAVQRGNFKLVQREKGVDK